MNSKIIARKVEHLDISLNKNIQAKEKTTGFEDIAFLHKALPELDKSKIGTSVNFLNHVFKAPLIVGAITGGPLEATKINSTIAEVVEELGLGMGVGSQRIAIENKKFVKSFQVARQKAETAFLIANLGGVQLVHGYGLKEVKKAINMIDADAIAFHLNALQEVVQPEGQTNFDGILEKIRTIVGELDIPVIIKETGAGISAEEAKKLEALGVKAIDVGGSGGTSFAAVEHYRSKRVGSLDYNLGDTFWDWGIPTAISTVEVSTSVTLPIISSGGIRTGEDIAKAIALGANMVSLSQPILHSAVKGFSETRKLLTSLMEELKACMFLVGAGSVEILKQQTPLVILGRTAEWLKVRRFNLEQFANRGREKNF